MLKLTRESEDSIRSCSDAMGVNRRPSRRSASTDNDTKDSRIKVICLYCEEKN